MPFTTLRNARHGLALAAVVLLAACSSKESRIESGLKKGAEFARLGDWDKANVEVRNVLQIDPKNARAYLISAQVGEGQSEIQRAYGSYLKAVELKPDLLEAKVGLARMYMYAGELDKARDGVRQVLAADPGHLGGRTLDAALLARSGKLPEAIAQASAVIDAQKVVPVETSLLLAGLHASQGHPAKALAVIERALIDEPRNTSLIQVAATIAANLPRTDPLEAKAVGYYKRATEAAPKNSEPWRAWAAYHLQRGEPDKAEAVLRDAVKADPGDAKRLPMLLDFLSTSRGVAAAEKEYKAAIAAKTRDMNLRFGLANLYRANNRPADAQAMLAEIVELSDDPASSLSAKTQLATYRLAAGQNAEARKLLTDVLTASPRDNAALLLRGRMSLTDGNARDAVQDLRSVLKDQPASAEVVTLLAQAHRKAGEPQLAREVLAEAVKFKPEDPALRLLLASDMAEAKEFRAAAAELDAGIKSAPQALQLYDAKAQLALAQKDTAGAEKVFKDFKAATPGLAAGYVRLGRFYADQNRNDAALKEYDAGTAAVPQDALPYIASIGLLVGTRKYAEANSRIDARLAAEPKNVLHHQLKGDVALAQRDLPAAEQAYRGAIAVAPTVAMGYINTARTLVQRNDVPGALAVLSQGEQAAPAELSIPLARAEWLARAKRSDEAIALYETLHQRAPDDDAIANNLAFLLADAKGDRASVERALTLVSRFANSSNPGYLDSLGWIHHQLGQYDKAVPLLERAVALAPASPILNLHLGKALVKNGDPARGKPYLRKAIDSKADLPRLDEARAMLAQG